MTLSIVPTPIGNLKDITLRALAVLKEARLIVCEDTRRTRKLLDHHGLLEKDGMARCLLSFHEHSGEGRVREILDKLREGEKVALVSDSGMPLISDPGFELLREALRHGIPVQALPGPSAFVTALAASGLAADAFSFFGFLSAKSSARRRKLAGLAAREETLVFYESPYRVLKVLQEMLEIFGDREAVVARELTKKFEEISRGLLSELAAKFSARKIMGEFVILVSGANRKRIFSK